jgi:hypothetical protein
MCVSFTHQCDICYTHYGGFKPVQVITWERYFLDHPGAPKYRLRLNAWHIVCKKLVLTIVCLDIPFHVTVLTNDTEESPAPDVTTLHWGELSSDIEIFEDKKVVDRMIGAGIIRFDQDRGLFYGHLLVLHLRCNDSIEFPDTDSVDSRS